MRLLFSLLLGVASLPGGGERPPTETLPAAGGAWAAGLVPSVCRRIAPHPTGRAPSSRGSVAEPPVYYAIELVTTKNVPGTARATGTGQLTFAASPFGVALAPDGSFLYDIGIQLSRMKRPAEGVLVAWITTPQVDEVVRLGALDESLSATGQVTWNKFLVVVTLEREDDAGAAIWLGPIVLRGMSRSGMMHTMAGHGPFQKELCAKYGY